jgi:ribosome-associated translation inhibitor RaiA
MSLRSGLDTSDSPAAREASAMDQMRALLNGTNINPVTGLATDYLNHFNEAVMLLDMLAEMQAYTPSSTEFCLDDLLAWQPRSYRAHFEASRLRERDLAIAAHEAADADVRAAFDSVIDKMNIILVIVRDRMNEHRDPQVVSRLAQCASLSLKPLIASAGQIINGASDCADGESKPQQWVDHLMARS